MNFKVLVTLTILVSNLLAIGGLDSIPSDQRKIAEAIKTSLQLNDKDTMTLYTERVEAYFDTKNWAAYYYSNDDIKNNKIADSKNRTMFLTLLNDSRIVNLSFVKFAKEKQVVVYQLETLPRTQQTVLDKFHKLEDDKEFEKNSEAPNYGYFTQTGYTSKINIYVSSPAGSIQYSDYYLYNIDK